MVQIHLGGVELPNDKEYNHLKRDIACEKTAIFDRLNRLVRCVVDCKAFDGDGISTRTGLELARAIVANSWENKPVQLNQIQGFGPVTVRRWIAHGVHTVLGVADRDFMEMERISGRNPPYGKNLSKTLEGFPRLTLQVVQLSRENRDSNDNVTVMVKANLGHCNTKRTPSWNGKVPAVTFMAEVSDGNLAYFWRGNIKKLDPARGLELKFPVRLSGPNQTVSCYFSCEEIVGTQIIKKIEPQIPDSAFDNIGTQEPRREPPRIDLLDSDIDLEDVEDADMLDALDSVTLDNEYPGPLDTVDGDFPLIDDILSQDPPLEEEPQKMENGKWMCHHHCRNGGTTKSGKPCSHKCCHEGVEKLRPAPQHRKIKGAIEEDTNDDLREKSVSSNHTQGKHPAVPRSKSTVSSSSNQVDLEPNGESNLATSQTRRSKTDRPNLKRARSFGSTALTNTSKKQMTRKNLPLEEVPQDADCIDLTMGPEDTKTGGLTNIQKKYIAEEKRRKELGNHYRKSQGNVHAPMGSNESYKNMAREFEESYPPEPVEAYAINPSVMANAEGGTQYDFDSDYEFPEISELFGLNDFYDTQSSREMTGKDETLYPGVVNTLKESINHGHEPNLSFTTVEELQKASQRLDIPSTSSNSPNSKPLSSHSTLQPDPSPSQTSRPPLAAIGLLDPYSLSDEDNVNEQPPVANHNDEPLFFDADSFQSDMDTEFDEDPQPQQNEPAWVAEADPQIIDFFRGHVNFVD